MVQRGHAPRIRATGIRRSFGQVEALRGAEFTAYQGEVVALIGDNGAGKSTLTRILVGADRPDAGELRVNGELVDFQSPADAAASGISVVYQDLALADHLDIPSNLFLGREITRGGLLGRIGFLDDKAMRREAERTYSTVGVTMPAARRNVTAMSGGQRQSLAVARAVAFGATTVFMDEPTAALGVEQTGRVLDLIRRLRDNGTTVVLISHNMTDVLSVADRVQVLRLGQRVAEFDAAGTSVEDLVAAMTGGVAR